MSDAADLASAVKALEGELVSASHWPDASFVRLPLVYPSGTHVTVRVERAGRGHFRVSDNGFAYRETESAGAHRSFSRMADAIAKTEGLSKDARAVFSGASEDQLARVIMDVASASWRIADKVLDRVQDDSEDDIVDYLSNRLFEIFGANSVKTDVDATLIGASTSPWQLSAVVDHNGKRTAFQAVSANANSIYRANAAFDDLYALDTPPGLVAVVGSKEALGSRLALLSRVARVIEESQNNDAFLRAAA